MARSVIHELVQYKGYTRRKFLDSMVELPWAQAVESCGASFDSVCKVFVHGIQAERVWIRWLSGKPTEGIYETPFSGCHSLDALRGYADTVEAEMQEDLETVTDAELQRTFENERRVLQGTDLTGVTVHPQRYHISEVLVKCGGNH